jgi:hypothetical protein
MSAATYRPGTLQTVRIVMVVCALFTAGTAAAQSGTSRVSVSSAGTQGNGPSRYPVISADGRWVAFYSSASTLVANDTNGVSDVFLHDRQTGATTRISVGPGGVQGNGESSEVAISEDGRWVAFESLANNLVAGDSNNRQDIFMHDQQTGLTTRVSVSTGNMQGNDNSWVPSISANGRWVAFDSWATNLVAGDTNATADIFVHDRETGTTIRASVGPGGIQTNGPSFLPVISAGGRWVAFRSFATNLVPGDTNGVSDIFLYDHETGTTTRVSVGPGGTQANGESLQTGVSGDGRLVVFISVASNLVLGDTNGSLDAFVHDHQTGVTSRVSVGPGGAQANSNSYVPVISADGRWVSFVSFASTLVASDTNGTADVFVHDRLTATTTRVSIGAAGAQGNQVSDFPAITADGRAIAYYSSASNLVPGDTNTVADVFVTANAGTIAGVVTSAATSAPVSNIFVSVYLASGTYVTGTYTNSQGAYTMPPVLATGSYYLLASPLSSIGLLCQLYQGLTCPATSSGLANGTPVAVTAPNTTMDINFALALAPVPLPGAFSKSSPANGATRVSTSAQLNWGASSAATSYEYCYDTTNDNSCAPWISTGSNRYVNLAGLNLDTTYYWHVRALNSAGMTYAQASATTFWSFRTKKSPPFVDLNGDGNADVLTYDPVTGNWARQVSQSTAPFSATTGTWAPGWSVSMARFNNDALTDFFLFNQSSGEWTKMINNGSGFTAQSSGEWWPGWERHILDLDGDGLSDVFLYDTITGAWFRAVSTDTGFSFTQGGWNPQWEVYPMRLNADAFGDLFLINRITGRWFWVLGDATGFSYPVSETWYPGWVLYPGDFNGDGLSDLLLHDPPTGTYFVATTTASGFTYQQGGWSLGWTPYVADLDANGMDDLFLHDPVTGVWFHMISNGAGSFANVRGQTWSLGWNLYPTDENGDGRAEMLLYDPATGAWYQTRNMTSGTFPSGSGTWAPGLKIVSRSSGR